MSEPNWVPLGVRGGIIDYVGGWSAATPYKPGDVVVYNGVQYLAVNPSTNQAPPAAASSGIPAALLDAKGDLIVASANDTPARLGVGANGQALIADPAQATGVKWASSELAYAEITANATLPVVAEASAATIITAPSVTFDGVTAVVIEFYSALLGLGAGASVYAGVNLWEGSTDLGRLALVQNNATATGSLGVPVYARRLRTPTAGAKVYSVRGWAVTAAGTLFAAAGYNPAFIRVARA